MEDRSTGVGDLRLINSFNEYIEQAGLRELKRGGTGFTWTGAQQNPVSSNIDRVLMTTCWE